jgi:hypothetical protein
MNNEPAPFLFPLCPTCVRPMRFDRSELDKKYPKLRHVIFLCDCGRRADQVIAEIL